MGTFLHVLSKSYKLSRLLNFATIDSLLTIKTEKQLLQQCPGFLDLSLQKNVFKYYYSYKVFTKHISSLDLQLLSDRERLVETWN